MVYYQIIELANHYLKLICHLQMYFLVACVCLMLSWYTRSNHPEIVSSEVLSSQRNQELSFRIYKMLSWRLILKQSQEKKPCYRRISN